MAFERIRLRDLTSARDEFHLAAVVQNFKTMALRLVGPPPREPVRRLLKRLARLVVVLVDQAPTLSLTISRKHLPGAKPTTPRIFRQHRPKPEVWHRLVTSREESPRVHSSGIPALRWPSIARSKLARTRGSAPVRIIRQVRGLQR